MPYKTHYDQSSDLFIKALKLSDKFHSKKVHRKRLLNGEITEYKNTSAPHTLQHLHNLGTRHLQNGDGFQGIHQQGDGDDYGHSQGDGTGYGGSHHYAYLGTPYDHRMDGDGRSNGYAGHPRGGGYLKSSSRFLIQKVYSKTLLNTRVVISRPPTPPPIPRFRSSQIKINI